MQYSQHNFKYMVKKQVHLQPVCFILRNNQPKLDDQRFSNPFPKTFNS